MADWNAANEGTGEGFTWDDTPANGADSFNDDFGNNDGANGCDDGMNNGDAEGGGDDCCRNCGQSGHFARDCTEPRKMGACFNCGEEGHSKSDCTKPRVFTGECRGCGQTGHRASDCPSKPKICGTCKAENDHDTLDCHNHYAFDFEGIPRLTEGACWTAVKEASDKVDMDDLKDALKALQLACPELTYTALEKKLRATNNRFYLIGLDKDIGGGYTNVNLQGEINKKYAISIYKSSAVPRPAMLAKWPKDPEENLVRLADAGVTLQRGVPYCNNCEKHGHARKQCDQDLVVPELAKVSCALCGEDGHRVRDCKEERQKPREPRTCKICSSEDHIAKECDQKPALECRNCGGPHMAKECDQPRKMICNNCDQEGHIGKECEKPRDWSRVTCRHCGEKGHASEKRCKPGAVKLNQDAGDENIEVNGDAGLNGGFDNAGGSGDFDNAGSNAAGDNNWQAPSGGNEWDAPAPMSVAATGGW